MCPTERVDLTERFFHAGEVADLSTLPQAEVESAFFRCWTRKEAIVKALGLGLSLDLDRFRVSCLPGVPPELLIAAEASPPAAAWSMFDLIPAPAHVGAIAVPQRPMTLVCRTLDLRAC